MKTQRGPKAVYLPPIDATPEEVAKALLATPPMHRGKLRGMGGKARKASKKPKSAKAK